MKSSYKISLLIATVLCIVVVIYYSNQSKPHEAVAIQAMPDPGWIDATPQAPTPPPAPSPVVAPPAQPSSPRVPEMRLERPATVTPPAPQPTQPPPAAPARQTPATYTVQAGDNLTRIAINIYGSESYWDEIAKANPRVDPAKLRVGQVLRLPDKAALDRGVTSTEPAAAAPGDTITYTVKAGDTLSTIAKAYGSDWQYIYNVNKSVIGSSPNNLKPGMKLNIPPTPRAAE